MKRVCIVTSGHLSTTPRLLKAARALQEAGYGVRVVSAAYVPWARAADAQLRKTCGWPWSAFDYGKADAAPAYYRTAARFKLWKLLARARNPGAVSFGVAARGLSRAFPELVKLAVAEPADLIYGGTTAGIPIVAAAARKLGAPFALDLEDFHSAEQDDNADSRLAHALIGRIEALTLADAAFLTAGSAAIAGAYREKYGVQPLVVNNVFPLPPQPPSFTAHAGPGLKLYWFSQTIGRGRGLEDVIGAMGLLKIPGELHLRGRPAAGYVEGLKTFAGERAPQLKLFTHPPESPEEMIRLAGEYEVGLSVEPGFSLNNRLALSNKSFTYMLAGLACVFTDTPGQRPLALDLGEGALLYRAGDVESLAAGLRAWAADKAALLRARRAAWEAARRRWHWEHPAERGTLLQAVGRVLKQN